ncbi:MAG: riboflavin synthase [Ignavibacteria bacterium]|nr:riboflavin synthase [Ignavibacteria bacterium]
MFTGIVEEVGKISHVERTKGGLRLQISAPGALSELKVNDSVSINGVCQTVISKNSSSFAVEAVEETLGKTTFPSLKAGDKVNVELPMRVNDRLGGHIVLGHVDAVGKITAIQARDNSWMFTVRIPEQFSKYIVPVGSIAIDGVSLTVAAVENCSITISIIPHTMDHTIFTSYAVGSDVNVEFDIIGKYIERMIIAQPTAHNDGRGLSEQYLRKMGY